MDRLMPSVSVVIPAYNEGRTIAEVVTGCVSSTPGLVEVIVVDDGSTDDTSQAAEAAGATVIRMIKNSGKGLAMQHGIRAAQGDLLVFIDADGQDDPSEIPLLLSAFEPQVDLVLGSRFLGGFRPGAITRLNYIGTKFIRGSLNVLFRTHVTDPLAGFRAVRAKVFEQIQVEARGYDIEVDLLLRVLKAGGQVAEVPAQRSARPYGSSGLSSIRDGTVIFLRIVRMRLRSSGLAVAPAPADGGDIQ
jgi:glycosyltransferase involved in cell wall biosynthesis